MQFKKLDNRNNELTMVTYNNSYFEKNMQYEILKFLKISIKLYTPNRLKTRYVSHSLQNLLYIKSVIRNIHINVRSSEVLMIGKIN